MKKRLRKKLGLGEFAGWPRERWRARSATLLLDCMEGYMSRALWQSIMLGSVVLDPDGLPVSNEEAIRLYEAGRLSST